MRLSEHKLRRALAAQCEHCNVKRRLIAAEEEMHLPAVVFDTEEGVVITDKDGRILRVNRGFTATTGFTPDEVIGKTLRLLQSGRHRDDFYREIGNAVRNRGYWSGEIWSKRRDGNDFPQKLGVRAVRSRNGEISHYVCVGQDLTDEKRAEEDRLAIDAARRVQESLFPSKPRVSGVDVAGAVFVAEHASGDYYDFISLPDDAVAFLVADVCGHGLGPALLMAQTQAYVRALAAEYDDPGEILTNANRFLRRVDTHSFVTIVFVHFDPETYSLVYCCAGHLAYLLRSSGEVVTLQNIYPPLGILDEQVYTSVVGTEFEFGDLLLLPTDGIWQSTSLGESEFGEQRMLELVWANRGKQAGEIVHLLCLAALGSDTDMQADDITAVVVKRV